MVPLSASAPRETGKAPSGNFLWVAPDDRPHNSRPDTANSPSAQLLRAFQRDRGRGRDHLGLSPRQTRLLHRRRQAPARGCQAAPSDGLVRLLLVRHRVCHLRDRHVLLALDTHRRRQGRRPSSAPRLLAPWRLRASHSHHGHGGSMWIQGLYPSAGWLSFPSARPAGAAGPMRASRSPRPATKARTALEDRKVARGKRWSTHTPSRCACTPRSWHG